MKVRKEYIFPLKKGFGQFPRYKSEMRGNMLISLNSSSYLTITNYKLLVITTSSYYYHQK